MISLQVLDELEQGGLGRSKRRVVGRIGLVVVLLVVGLVLAVMVSSDTAARQGHQVPSGPEVVLRQAPVSGWEPLVPISGRLRAGFPEPMVWRSDRVCLGFGRADFDADNRRPSLARCERQPPPGSLALDEIRSVHVIESGFDTWHFIEAADRVEAVSVTMSTGESLSGDRIHLSDSTIALLLENGRDLMSFEWATRTQTFTCGSDPLAWRTSQFCPASSQAR